MKQCPSKYATGRKSRNNWEDNTVLLQFFDVCPNLNFLVLYGFQKTLSKTQGDDQKKDFHFESAHDF